MFEEMTPVFTEKALTPYDICELHGKNLKIFVGEDVVDGERTTVVFGSDIDSGVQYVLEVRKTEEKESVVTDGRESVAYISHTSEGDILGWELQFDILGWERQFDTPSHTPLCPAPQQAEQQPTLGVGGLTEALRQYRHNDGSELLFGYDKPLVDQHVAALVTLLDHAQCPNCDGSGARYGSHGQVEQCQWCHERDAALAAHRKGGDV